jgi:hypothetical protein
MNTPPVTPVIPVYRLLAKHRRRYDGVAVGGKVAGVVAVVGILGARATKQNPCHQADDAMDARAVYQSPGGVPSQTTVRECCAPPGHSPSADCS